MIAMALILACSGYFPMAAAPLTTDPHMMSPNTAIWVQPGAVLSTILLLQYATQHVLPSHIHKLSSFSEPKYSCICYLLYPTRSTQLSMLCPEELHIMRSFSEVVS